MLTKQELLAMPEDDYMNDEQLAYFSELLLVEAADIKVHLKEARDNLSSQTYEADELDKAAQEEERRLQLRFLDRQTKLLPKIEQALARIKQDDFGYCKITGDAIGVQRLLLRPTATLCAEEKNRQEIKERSYRDQ
ncbi:MAG: TraR/DksA C4-type zinc finger protein [Saccharospirillaceae bacterium]|nr:TraR/DksA C4-type zinc finger protein [Pseudomonadales bacterium]NRB79479.1 TraR/DksA C4-type zinc finger protein [Saccharospirillaceae bacterium]